MKSTDTAVLITLALLMMVGCGANIEHQEVTKAPQSSSQLGWIATQVTPEQHIEIMQSHPAGQFRNHGNGFAYEYRGLSKAEILEIAPEAKVEKNIFLPIQSVTAPQTLTTSNKVTKFLATSPDVEFAPGNCIENTVLSTPKIEIKNLTAQSSKAPAEVGHKIGLSNDKNPADNSVTAWMVLPPNGSKIQSELIGSESISFKPDMAGAYAVVLLYKKNGQCNFGRADFFVTNNSPYKPELSPEEEQQLDALSKRSFYQLNSTKADSAQRLLANIDFQVTKVAVLDSGVNYNSPALKRRMWTNPLEIPGDGVDNDNNGLVDDFVGYDFADDDAHPMDDFGHGSHVAGLVAGEYMGTSSDNVQIIAVKVGGTQGPDLGSIVSGIMYAIEKEAQIINMSFGSTVATESIKAAVKAAHDAGILVVSASGNGDQFGIGIDNDKMPNYPSSYETPNILAVGAARIDDRITGYSNYGLESVDIITAGGFSDRRFGPLGLLSSAYIPNPAGIVTQPQAGTSMAAPVAAGVAGIILSAAPELSPSEVIEILMSTGRKVPSLEDKIKSGAILDAEAALMAVLNSRLD